MSELSTTGILGVIVGLVLVVIPDPATTATGMGIVAISVGADEAISGE